MAVEGGDRRARGPAALPQRRRVRQSTGGVRWAGAEGRSVGGAAWTGVAVAGVTAAYALVSRQLSSVIVFIGSGILIGPAVLGMVDLEHDATPVISLLEAAPTLVLFTDAMTVRRRDLAAGGFLPGRLLGIGLPLSIGAGWVLAWLLPPGLTVWELALVLFLAAIPGTRYAEEGAEGVF